MALALTAAAVLSFSAAAMPFAFGAGETTTTASGKTPIAAFDFTEDLKDHSGRTDVDAVVLDKDTEGKTDAELLKSTSNSGRAEWVEGSGIKLQNGFFKLPDNIFSDTDISKIDGFTVSFTLNKVQNPNGHPWEILFSFADKDYFADKANSNWLPEGERSDTSVHMVYHGCIGTGAHPYMNDWGGGCWVDGALDAYDHESPIFKYGETHKATVTYETATNTLALYVDGMLVRSSLSSGWTIKAKLTNEDIKNFTSLIIGRGNDGYEGWWGNGTYSDVTIYSTALTPHEVRTLANEGWEAVEKLPVTPLVLDKDVPVLDGKGDGTFTAAAFNVDGLPVDLTVCGIPANINKDGPGSDGTKKMSQLLAEKGWDIITTSENFNYNDELMTSLSDDYKQLRGDLAKMLSEDNMVTFFQTGGKYFDENNKFIPFDTDGLSLLYKKGLSAEEIDRVAWNLTYSTNPSEEPIKTFFGGYDFPMGNGADGLIAKGFRHFVVNVTADLKVDVYTFHMDAETDIGDNNARASQIDQLVEYILKTETKNPIIIMGDTNCRYTRDDVLGSLIGRLNAEDNLYARDAWVDTKNNGKYPALGSNTLGSEIVDKIIYVNNTKCDYQLCLTNYSEEWIKDGNKNLSDHPAVVGTFAYAKKCTVTYTDGVNGEAFKPQTINTLSTNKIPAFNGTPERDGYEFAGWKPAITDASKVTGNMEFVATWTAKTDDTTAKTDDTTASSGGQQTPPPTGDTAHTLVWVSVCAVSMIGAAVAICGKSKSKGGKKE